MMILTEEITKALNEGYELTFKRVDGYGPNVLDIQMRKGGKAYHAYEDFLMCRDHEEVTYDIDRAIRYIKYSFNEKGQ